MITRANYNKIKKGTILKSLKSGRNRVVTLGPNINCGIISLKSIYSFRKDTFISCLEVCRQYKIKKY